MECSICLDEFEQIPQTENSSLLKGKKYKNAHELSCGHMFHKKCINNWLKNNSHCPYCRKYFKNTFRCYVTKKNKTLGKLAYINIENENPKEIVIDFLNFIFKKKDRNKTPEDTILFTKYNILGVQYNYKNTIYIRYFTTLHDIEEEIDIYVFNKNDCNYIYESFIKVIKNHYISKSKITFDVVEEDETLQNLNSSNLTSNISHNTQLNNVKIVSRGSSVSSFNNESEDDNMLLHMVFAPVITYSLE
jgi:hypothetical protein